MKIKHHGCEWWTYVSSSPSQEDCGGWEEQRRKRRFVWINMFFKRDVRNWDSGGIADVPGLSALQTQDTHKYRNASANKHIYTRRDSRALGEPRFQSAFKWCCAKSPYIIVRIYIKRQYLHKCGHMGTKNTAERIFKWLDFFCPSDTHATHTNTNTCRTPIPSHTRVRSQSHVRFEVKSCDAVLHTRTWQTKWCDWHLSVWKSQDKIRSIRCLITLDMQIRPSWSQSHRTCGSLKSCSEKPEEWF